MFEPLGERQVDLILCSPRQGPTPPEIIEAYSKADPYLYWSVVGGSDGLEMIKQLIAEAPGHLHPGGRLQILVMEYLVPQVTLLMQENECECSRTASTVTELTRIGQLHRSYIEALYNWHFEVSWDGKIYTNMVILTGQKQK